MLGRAAFQVLHDTQNAQQPWRHNIKNIKSCVAVENDADGIAKCDELQKSESKSVE
jgi:hypothetical protein